jgi:hypothetical protein
MRITALLLAVPMVIAVGGCTSANHAPSPSASTSPTTSTAAAPPRSSSPVAPSSTPSRIAVTSTRATTPPPVVPATNRVTVRPVTAAGQPAAGYQVTTETWPDFTCTAGAFAGASPSAVGPDIRFCGPSASNTVACWKSAVPTTVLCLRDPFGHVLVRVTYAGTFAPVAAPANPAPQGLLLADGTRCLIRDGGAWSFLSQRPGWVGWYWCSNGSDVYGPQGGYGIDRSAPMWTVQTVDEKTLNATTGASGPITEHAVTTAYYDGTA